MSNALLQHSAIPPSFWAMLLTGAMCDHETTYNTFEDSNTFPSDHVKQIGDDFGIARGGKGVILQGGFTSERRGRVLSVGIKRLFIKGDTEDDTEKVKQALRREIAVWCNLQDQNVLLLLGTVIWGPTLYNYLPRSTVFEYYASGDLKQYGAKMNPSDLEILKLLRGTAAGLAYVHQQGIVHGDLKDVNVVVEEPGKARLCDFGSAHILGCTNCIAGPPNAFDSLLTQRYLSPEIRRGEIHQTTQQSDVWALGCVLLEVQTGILPYKSDNDNAFGWIKKQLKGEYPAKPNAFASSNISVDIGEIAFRCWEREPNKRPQAQSVLQDLERLCAKYDAD